MTPSCGSATYDSKSTSLLHQEKNTPFAKLVSNVTQATCRTHHTRQLLAAVRLRGRAATTQGSGNFVTCAINASLPGSNIVPSPSVIEPPLTSLYSTCSTTFPFSTITDSPSLFGGGNSRMSPVYRFIIRIAQLRSLTIRSMLSTCCLRSSPTLATAHLRRIRQGLLHG